MPPERQGKDRPRFFLSKGEGDHFLWDIPLAEDTDPSQLKTVLRERIKELNALYALSRIAADKSDSIEGIIQSIVEIIPPSWQYPEITRVRITFRDKVAQTPGFRMTPWRLSSTIQLNGTPAGDVTVCYLEERNTVWEGPFLQEERILINSIAERITCLATRIMVESDLRKTNEELMRERQALLETNIALKVLISSVEEEKGKIQEDIRDRVEEVIKPLLYQIYLKAPRSQKKYVDLLVDNLEELTQPFSRRVPHSFDSLSTTETQICHMIKSGLRTKDIAELRSVSPTTVCRHRDRIRRKLGLSHARVNLATYLKNEMK